MTVLDRAADQIGAAAAMSFNRDGWRDRLDCSVDGVLNSFTAALFAAPLALLYSITMKRAAARIPELSQSLYGALSILPLIVADLATFAVDWAASLALLATLSRAVGEPSRAAALIAGYNWLQPVIVALQLPALALVAATASAATGSVLGLPAIALTIALLFGLVRRGLGVGLPQAAAIVAMLLLVGVVIDALGDAALRALFLRQS